MAGEADRPSASAAESIFLAALERSSPERPGFLTDACGTNKQLRQRVQALLTAHEAPKGFLPEEISIASAATFLDSTICEQAGDTIGRYKLRQHIGEGGCGIVYLAEQTEPVRRRVALKVIKLGMDTRQVIARFEAERQSVAMMDHPNIARVLDAGATDAGRPYFVMELVGGVKITDYCDQNNFSTRQRLDLFIQVCRAIQHAHQKGIIHRDIKPSNVLVATQDGVPIPKVIDFGIAKATQGRLTDHTVFTAFEQFLGTPAYMSPEQAELGGLDVDTRSDIYSLGVLLYELLTGKTPFDTKAMMAGGLDEIRRTIKEKEPLTPSTRLREEFQLRNPSEPELRERIKLVRGDLDWIVMKCLEKDRARRYETANGLAMDIERHLRQEPVVARPPSAAYKAQKFIRRNRAVTAIAFVLVLGFSLSSWEAIRAWRAEREQIRLRRDAQAARQDAIEKLRDSYLAQAGALRMSGRAGRRFESLSALRKAAAIRPSLALRNEAIACLPLSDIQRFGTKDFSASRQSIAIEPGFERYSLCQPGGEISVRRLSDDHELARLPSPGAAAIHAGPFSQDGRFLSVAYHDNHRRIWDSVNSTIVITLPGTQAVEFSPDSRTAAVSDATNIVIYAVPGGQILRTISLLGLISTNAPGWFRFDRTGERLALFTTEEETNVFVLDARTGLKLKTIQHTAPVLSVAWHPEAVLLATGCADKTVHIWDSRSGEKLREWRTESSVSLDFNHRGTVLASSGWDGHTRLWDVERATQLIAIYQSGHILGFSPDDSKVVTDAWEGTKLEIFEVAYGHELRTPYEVPETDITGTERPIIDASGTMVVSRASEGIALWDLSTMRRCSAQPFARKQSLVGFDAEAHNLILTGPEGLFRCPITKSGDGRPSQFGQPLLVTAECADVVAARMGWVSADGHICAIVGNSRCQLFRTDTFEKLSETGAQPTMRFGGLNRDGSLFASGAWRYPGVSVWNTQTGALVRQLPVEVAQTNSAASVAFSPDDRYLVAGTAYDYRFWDVVSWSLARIIPQEPGNDFFPFMAFSRDGKILAGTHSRSKIRLHDAATGRVLTDLEAPGSKMITGMAFNGDSTQLAVCDSTDSLRVWDLRKIRAELARLGLDWD
jgi:eukaryotic-like serine/threonine-protein kinase